MAKPNKKKKSKDALPIEIVNQILNMKPEDLAVEAAREGIAIQELKDQCKSHTDVSSLEDKIKEMDKAVNNCEEVLKAKEDLEKVKEKNRDESYDDFKQDLKALKDGFNNTNDIKDRIKKQKFMMKTLKKHMNSGALKSRVD